MVPSLEVANCWLTYTIRYRHRSHSISTFLPHSRTSRFDASNCSGRRRKTCILSSSSTERLGERKQQGGSARGVLLAPFCALARARVEGVVNELSVTNKSSPPSLSTDTREDPRMAASFSRPVQLHTPDGFKKGTNVGRGESMGEACGEFYWFRGASVEAYSHWVDRM